jgi:hypothetical protein
MVAAIEIYNKPRFEYRDEVFAILLLNAWELLLKALHAGIERLFRSEVARLRLGDPVETVVIDSVRHTRDIIPQTSDSVGAKYCEVAQS